MEKKTILTTILVWKGKEEWHMIDPTNKGLEDGFEIGYYPERLDREVVRE